MFRRIFPRVASITRTSSVQISRPPFPIQQHGRALVQIRLYAPALRDTKYSFSEEQANLGGPSAPFKLSVALEQDYDQVAIFHQGAGAAPTLDEKRGFQNALIWELARHIVAKELVVFPAVEELVDNGKELVEKERHAHQKIKELMADFQDMQPDDRQFDTALSQLYNKFQDTVRNMERDAISELESKTSLTTSKELCIKYARTKHFAPTRSHPWAPDNSRLFESATALLTAPLDKLKDLFRRFPKDGDGAGGGHDKESLSAGPNGAPYELHKKNSKERSIP